MTILTDFLRRVQGAGWLIKFVTDESTTVGCPREGCNLSIKLRHGGHIPQPCRAHDGINDIDVDMFDAGRVALRSRREELFLTIRELEEIIGCATDHIAKAEKDDPSRIINVNLFCEWAAALGYKVVLRPTDLPKITLRYLSDTRSQVRSRQTRREAMRKTHRPR